MDDPKVMLLDAVTVDVSLVLLANVTELVVKDTVDIFVVVLLDIVTLDAVEDSASGPVVMKLAAVETVDVLVANLFVVVTELVEFVGLLVGMVLDVAHGDVVDKLACVLVTRPVGSTDVPLDGVVS